MRWIAETNAVNARAVTAEFSGAAARRSRLIAAAYGRVEGRGTADRRDGTRSGSHSRPLKIAQISAAKTSLDSI